MEQRMRQALGLLDLYVVLFQGKYNRKPAINRYKEKWALADVVDSLGFERAKEVIQYYFKCTRPGHPLTWFLYNFDRLDESMKALAADEEKRKKLRAETKQRVEEWEIEHRSQSNISSLQE